MSQGDTETLKQATFHKYNSNLQV